MKENRKSFLKSIHLYAPLRAVYSRGRSFIQNRYHRLAYHKYKGKGYSCNFCGSTYLKMVPESPSSDIAKALNANQVITGYGDNVYCPYCESKNRERLIKAVISGYLIIHKKTILHLAPEKHLFRWVNQFGDVVTAKPFEATHLPFHNGAFDILIANQVLGQIPDDRKAMREFHRVLAKNGVAILQAPYSSFLPSTIEYPSLQNPAQQAALFGHKDNVRIYSLDDYVLRLIQTGFRVRVLTPSELAPYRKYAIPETESVFLCYK